MFSRLLFIILIALFGMTSFVHADDLSLLDNKAKESQVTQLEQDKLRTQTIKQTRVELEKKLNALKRSIKQVENETQQLSSAFSQNEKALTELEKQLQIETGSLGELFGVVRQGAKSTEQIVMSSVIQRSEGLSLAPFDRVTNTDTLPSIAVLSDYVNAMATYIEQSRVVTSVMVNRLQGDGLVVEEGMIRVGDMALLSDRGDMQWDRSQAQAEQYSRYPDDATNSANFTSDSMLIDVTRGGLLTQYAEQPTLLQRIEQAGIVGQIILGSLLIGLIITVYRGVVLMTIQWQISKQLLVPETPSNNPLGRILSVYDKEKGQNLESLELRLLEAIMDEQQGLEKGLSMLKLLAALAPMLGLLGTVTGMIETFQVITQFGNGDPKVMAGGISMALTTTVLGLVAAMPLLLAHNLLSSRADSINATLEKQGVSLVAAKAESDNARII
ncbi:MotA/TolQ/ExbB proton channel family protein [uncultured Aliivibrio sp.]|uniref:MotA/TolQ/ExbB proton channel family protein n=1 Tax=uncultured Aliivibrio sp. TaxID=873085 RepID=UPI0026218F28|nr:MotA/TolQ/ExbB proton channel family protein [uncultured Aliivibrio sp.]